MATAPMMIPQKVRTAAFGLCCACHYHTDRVSHRVTCRHDERGRQDQEQNRNQSRERQLRCNCEEQQEG